MPRFKTPDYGLKMIPVDFDRQVIPGSFEHALCHLVDHEIDLAGLEARYRNDCTGAPAFAPNVLLKIVLLGYSRGLVSSRAIAAACRDNVLFMAVSGDSAPHFTTIAGFVAELGDEAARIFARVLMICDWQGLIGRELFAIDGVRLPANASKARSGNRADFMREADKMEVAVKRIMASHATADIKSEDAEAAKAARTVERLKAEAAKIRAWLDAHPDDRRSAKGKPRLSNRTDNESAKMATGKGVIQGYTGVAVVDAKTQIVADAQAHGTGSEQELLLPVVEVVEPFRTPNTTLCADAGYHLEANLKALAEGGVEAYICDNDYRNRDARYAGQASHKDKPDPLWDKRKVVKKARCFRPADFTLAEDRSHCVCPAGRQQAVLERLELHLQRLCGDEVSRCRARLCAVSAARPVLAHPRHDQDAPGRLLSGQARQRRALHRADETTDRLRHRQAHDHRTLCHRRAGLRQPEKQQAAPSLHIARARQGRWAVEALLPGAQHREVGSPRVCTMSGTDPGDTPLYTCNGRTSTTEDEQMTDSG